MSFYFYVIALQVKQDSMKKIISFIFLFFVTFSSYAHVGHHKNLKNLKFDIYRNGQYAGFHHINFDWKKDESLEVENIIDFGVKKFGITFYQYSSKGIEKYNSTGKMTSFSSKTDDNGREKFCDIKLNDNKYYIKGTKFDGILIEPFLISSYWNHDIVTVPIQISGITCKKTEQKVNFLKEETFKVAGKSFQARVFDIQGEKLDTQVWFDQKTRMIVHQVLNKKGKWEYKLKEYNLN